MAAANPAEKMHPKTFDLIAARAPQCRVAEMVEMRSDSPRRGRPISTTGALDAETGSILLAVEMMSEDVETWHRGYVSTAHRLTVHMC